MNFKSISTIALVSIVATVSAHAAPSKQCETVKQADVLSWINSIQNYQLSARVKTQEAPQLEIKAQHFGQKPNFLRIDMVMDDGKNSMQHKIVFDGTYQWNESQSKLGSQITKLKLSAVTDKNRPFDTYMYMMGSGLINGEDYPDTLKTLFTVYETQPHCDESNKLIVFQGMLNKQKFEHYVMSGKYAKQRQSNIERYASTFGFINITVDPANRQVKSYAMGNAEEKMTINVEFDNIKLNSKLPSDTFSYKAPKDIEIVDITEDVLKQVSSSIQ